MNHGRFLRRVGSRKKVVLLGCLLSGLLLVTVLVSPAFASTGVVSLSLSRDGFVQSEFFDVAGITMNGQTLSLDFRFENGVYIGSENPVWAELFLQTGPHNTANPDGDYPYNQYVIFEPGSTAYLLNENGQRLDGLMSDWNGGVTNAPGPTLGVLSTDRGNAGADMIAFPLLKERIGGVHFDLVLPNTGQTIYLGRIGMKGDVEYEGQYLIVQNEVGVAEQPQEPVTSPSEPNSVQSPVTPTDVSTSNPPPERNAIRTGFTVGDLGAKLFTTAGRGAILTGYGTIHPDDGQTTPSGLIVMGDRRPGFLVNETAVTHSPLVKSGRTYVEVSRDGSVNTGIAVANPNAQDASITFELRNEAGDLYRVGSFTLKGAGTSCESGSDCNQLSRFVDDLPFNSGRGIQGTLTLLSNVPVSMFAVRGFFNERTPSDFLMSPLPVVDLAVAPAGGLQVIPHYAIGYGGRTQVVLVNPTGSFITGEVEFLDISGNRVFVTFDRVNYRSRLIYSIAPNGIQTFAPVEVWPSPSYGSVRVKPAGDAPAPIPFAILGFQKGGTTISETAVVASAGTAYRMFAQMSPSGRIQTGVAVASPADTGGTVSLSLSALDGSFIASTSFYLPPEGHVVDFLDSLFPSLAGSELQGVLRITTDLPSISVTSLRLRYNEKPDPDALITATVPVMENGLPDSRDRYFPYLINGEGFTTEIIIFSGKSGQSSSGNFSFFHPDGTPFDLEIW